jgi:hypothetical protein
VNESTDEGRTMSTDTELTRKLQELVDRNEIVDCLTRYTRGMDRQDRELVRSAFHDDAIDLHRSLVSDVDGFLEWTFAYHAKQSLHQHYIMNHTIEIDGDTAHAETYCIGTFLRRDEPVVDMAGGRYIDRLERRDGEWRISRRVVFPEVAFRVDKLASEHLSYLADRPQRSREDLSYSALQTSSK